MQEKETITTTATLGDILKTPVALFIQESFEKEILDKRTMNCLFSKFSYRDKTVQDIVDATPSEVLSIRHFGTSCLIQLWKALQASGIENIFDYNIGKPSQRNNKLYIRVTVSQQKLDSFKKQLLDN